MEIFQGRLADQVIEIARRLKLQRRAYPEGLLGIICPRLVEVRAVASSLQGQNLSKEEMCVQDRDDGYQALKEGRPIWISTVHSAKGLEFRALHFAAAEFVKSFRGEQKRIAYTGITRAKTALTIYHDKQLPGYLDSALNVVRVGSDGSEGLEAAFGRRE